MSHRLVRDFGWAGSCTVRGDLIRIMTKILKKTKTLDGIIIETTGLADPAPVAQTFFMDEVRWLGTDQACRQYVSP